MFRSSEARPTCETDRGTASAARLLLLVVGMCAHSVEAQSTLVTEVKSALARTVALPEAHTSKHARIQALAALVSHLAEVANPSASQQDPNRSALRFFSLSSSFNLCSLILETPYLKLVETHSVSPFERTLRSSGRKYNAKLS